jgi:hypothetical protein
MQVSDPTAHGRFSSKADRTRFLECGRVFNPGSPLNERALFAGRSDQMDKIVHAVSQRGYHAILYGERGVGKTSLSKVLREYLDNVGKNIVMSGVNCDASDDFSSLWSKAFRDVVITQAKPGIGLTATKIEFPERIAPNDVTRALTAIGDRHKMVIIFDEFDRIKDKATTVMMADTIKALSDRGLQCTILLIGVAESVDELIQEHNSIERVLVQVHLSRMTDDEVKEIITKGLSRLAMEIRNDALSAAATLCQGLPYVTHLLALHSAREALKDRHSIIGLEHIQRGVRQSLSHCQQSVISAYFSAVSSHQPGNIFKEVLAACSMAQCDNLGYFTAAAVREPLRIVTGRNYDILNFSRHLNEFSKTERGPVLQRAGKIGRVRYRFVSPLIKTYAIMRSVADGILTNDSIAAIKSSEVRHYVPSDLCPSISTQLDPFRLQEDLPRS